MSVSYEWHRAQLDSWNKPELLTVADLESVADDVSDFTPTTVGVCFSDGGGGGIVYGEPHEVIAWYAHAIALIAARLGDAEPEPGTGA